MIKTKKQFFRRGGDGASSRYGQRTFTLMDNTTLSLVLEIIYYPKDCYTAFYFSANTCDGKRRWVNSWDVSKTVARKVYPKILAEKNKLAYLPWKQRKRILDVWFKQTRT